MSRSLGPALTSDLLARLSQVDLPARLGRALPLITLDAQGRPHPMLLSPLEVLAVAPDRLRVVIGAGSRSEANLQARGAGTLLVLDADLAVYVKCRAVAGPLRAGGLSRFDLVVEDVLEDLAGGEEGGTRLTGGVTYAPPQPLDAPWVRATLRLLRAAGGGQEASPAESR
jgi:hypothetical protein